MNFGEKLRELRLKRNKTQEEVAEAVGIDQCTLSTYERSERRPGDKTKVKLAKYYNETVQNLFFSE